MLIRLARDSDGTALAEIYRPVVLGSPISFEVEPPDPAEMARRIVRVTQRTPWLVCERDGVVMGYAYADRHRERAAYQWSVDVAVYVHCNAQRMGLGRKLYDSLFSVLAAQGFSNAYAGITLPNIASVSLHLAMGFTPLCIYRGVGYKHGRWHDVEWFQLSLNPRVSNPPPPIPLPELRNNAALEALINRQFSA